MRAFLYSKNIFPLFFLALSAIAVIALSIVMQFLQLQIVHLWVTHLTLELISVFVAISVVAVIFQRKDPDKSSFSNTIVFGFSCIALLDYFHTLSYPGMPNLFTASSPEKAIVFWLFARSIELLTFIAIAFKLKLKGRKLNWLLAAIALSTLIFYINIYHSQLLPPTFDPATGVTDFKTNAEFSFFIGYALLTGLYWYQYTRSHFSQHLYFAAASFAMALCALTLTHYLTTSDFALLLGHLFKIVSAIFIYMAIYWHEIKRPYQLAHIAEQKTDKKELELQTILESMPLGVVRFDQSLKLLYTNSFAKNMSHIFKGSQVDQHLSDVFPAKIASLWQQHCVQALSGKKAEFYYEYNYADNVTVYREVIVVPEKKLAGQTLSILCLVVDASEKEHAKLKELSALRETEKLRKALDEHAIVAYTDIRGIITSVNDKFCQISQYSRQELIGNSHQLINSKYHPRSFFKDMWLSISTGKIWQGEICNKAKDGSLYWVNTTIVPFLNDRGKPEQYIAIRADITERKLAEQEALRLAYYDELTSLPNRRLLKEQLERSINNSEPSTANVHALLLIDLDNFKDVNDSLGHAMGDELLKQVAMRLQHSTYANQTIARLGGDEFVILIANLATSKQEASIKAGDQAEHIRVALSEPYTLENEIVSVTPSIGVTLLDSTASDAAEFLKQADIAMYQSKARGRNQVTFFDPQLQFALNQRNDILRELVHATDKQELILYYQPIYNQQKAIVGTEALIRWNNSQLGMVPPDQFIPVAEQANHILVIGNWVLHTACQQLQQWASDKQRAHWTIAVNISAKQLQQKDFVDIVTTALTQYQVPPQRLKLEITESMLQEDVDNTIAAMSKLREIGVRFSLDDFGTGYSSLSYLTKLPIDTLKIDRSFVDNMINSKEDTAVVKAILSLAASLKLEVVAEGVETAEQMAFLISAGCQHYQGYLLSKPLPIEQLLLLDS